MNLEEELTGITGVARARVQVLDGEPATLHVELAKDVDRAVVADAVNDVLRRHGLRSRDIGPSVESTQALTEGVPAAEDVEPGQLEDPDGRPVQSETEGANSPTDDVGVELTDPPPAEQQDAPLESTSLDGDGIPASTDGVASVSVTQRQGSVTARVETVSGRVASSGSVARPEALEAAIAAAVGQLLATSVVPSIVEVRRQDVGARPAMTVIVELSVDQPLIGTVFERGTPELALARAIWAALTST